MPSRGHCPYFHTSASNAQFHGLRETCFPQCEHSEEFLSHELFRLWPPVLWGAFSALPEIIQDPKLCLFTRALKPSILILLTLRICSHKLGTYYKTLCPHLIPLPPLPLSFYTFLLSWLNSSLPTSMMLVATLSSELQYWLTTKPGTEPISTLSTYQSSFPIKTMEEFSANSGTSC